MWAVERSLWCGQASVQSSQHLPPLIDSLWLCREELGCGDEAGHSGAADSAGNNSSEAPAAAGESIPDSARDADPDAEVAAMAAATSAPSAMAESAMTQEGGGGDVFDEEAGDPLETETDAAHAAAAQDGMAADEGSSGQAGSLRRRCGRVSSPGACSGHQHWCCIHSHNDALEPGEVVCLHQLSN